MLAALRFTARANRRFTGPIWVDQLSPTSQAVHWGILRYYEGLWRKPRRRAMLEEFCLVDFNNDAKRFGKALLMRESRTVGGCESSLKGNQTDWENFRRCVSG